jgi:hypothetical protein
MIQLEAACMGYAVPRCNFDAEVHSTFTSAANLQLLRGSLLLTLVAGGEADLPQGIRLNTTHGFSFEGLQTKESVTCRDGILRCEYAPLTIDLRMARRWKCNLLALAANMNSPSTSAACQIVEQELDQWRAHARIGLPACHVAEVRRMDESVPDLVATTRRCDLAGVERVIASLIGLGSGLTPSGDDFLVGYLAGLWCSSGEWIERTRFLTGIGKAVTRLSHRTNSISRTYLVHAARGQVSSRLAALAEAICRGESSDQLIKTATAAIEVGHDSGMEAVEGLLQGLSVCNGDRTQVLLIS